MRGSLLGSSKKRDRDSIANLSWFAKVVSITILLLNLNWAKWYVGLSAAERCLSRINLCFLFGMTILITTLDVDFDFVQIWSTVDQFPDSEYKRLCVLYAGLCASQLHGSNLKLVNSARNDEFEGLQAYTPNRIELCAGSGGLAKPISRVVSSWDLIL